MRHDWVFEVLTDLAAYAEKNGLPALAASATKTLQVARAEIAAAEDPSEGELPAPKPADRRRH